MDIRQASSTLWDRLWAKVTFPEDPHDCWLWTGAKSKKRRGQRRPAIQIGGRKTPVVNAARLVCEWLHGPPPNELYEAGHTCPEGENDLCVNPLHLQWMTRVENEQFKQQRRAA